MNGNNRNDRQKMTKELERLRFQVEKLEAAEAEHLWETASVPR